MNILKGVKLDKKLEILEHFIVRNERINKNSVFIII